MCSSPEWERSRSHVRNEHAKERATLPRLFHLQPPYCFVYRCDNDLPHISHGTAASLQFTACRIRVRVGRRVRSNFGIGRASVARVSWRLDGRLQPQNLLSHSRIAEYSTTKRISSKCCYCRGVRVRLERSTVKG